MWCHWPTEKIAISEVKRRYVIQWLNYGGWHVPPPPTPTNMSPYVPNVSPMYTKSCHITPILKELHWLPVSQRIVFKLMLIVHKSVNNIAPIYISELLKVYTPSRNLRSSNMSLLKEPTSKQTWGDRSFSVAAPRIIFQLNSNHVIV